MLNKVLLTFITRILTALLSVVNVLIGTNYLGVEGYGTISLIILGITIYLMIQNLITGPSIIYYISRFSSSSILLVSYLWTIISVVLFSGIIFISGQVENLFDTGIEIVPKGYEVHNILLAAGYGLMAIHLNVLLGKERIKAYNFIFLFQHLLASILLVFFYIILNKSEMYYYILSLYVSYFSAFILAFFLSLKFIEKLSLPSADEFKKMLRYGTLGQSANVFQLINYRLSYYLIDIFAGRASLGVFSAATQISEGLWIFGKSIATVQFAHLSNSNDTSYARNLSLRLLKFVSGITLLPLLILMVLPISFYTFLLGEDFTQVRSIIQLLALGTLVLSASMALSNYFSGTGWIGMNTRASGLGVIVSIAFGFALIPWIGIQGAAITSSLSYLVSFIYLIFRFNKQERIGWKDLVLTKRDLIESWNILLDKIQVRKTD